MKRKIDAVMNATNCDKTTAAFYLGLTGWKSQAAITLLNSERT
jgi:hypothetical protein